MLCLRVNWREGRKYRMLERNLAKGKILIKYPVVFKKIIDEILGCFFKKKLLTKLAMVFISIFLLIKYPVVIIILHDRAVFPRPSTSFSPIKFRFPTLVNSFKRNIFRFLTASIQQEQINNKNF